MNRCKLLSLASLLGCFSLLLQPSNSIAGLDCTPWDMNGVRRCEAGIDSYTLDVVASDRQHATQWCWAACIEAVFNYYGHPVSQERIVKEVWGSIVNLPGQPNQILGALNREWIDDNGDCFQVSGSTFGVNNVTAAQDLANDRPLIIGALGHAMVLTSMTYLLDGYGRYVIQAVEIRDPWPLSPGHRDLSLQEWANISFAARIVVTDMECP